MKFLFTLFCFVWASVPGFAQHWQPTEEGSEVKFKIKNFGVNVSGSFKGIQGKIEFHPDTLATSVFDVTVQTNTISTGINQRDNHLKQEEYFDVTKYPTIHFISTKITTSTNKEYLFVFGKLTIKDVTKEISFPFKVTPKDGDFIFEGEFPLNRRDFNVGGGSISMSDNLTVELIVLAKKKNS